MTRLRLCPTVDGTVSPLITHMIEVETCLGRQRALYHKCHRCIYRGMPATFEAPLPAEVEPERNGKPAHIPADRATTGVRA